jgi:hypothetical protein
MFSSDQGVASVEYAFVVMPFIGLVVAIFQAYMAQTYITYLDRAVQKFAAELRSGSVILKDVNTRASVESLLSTRLCPQIPVLLGIDCSKLQVQLFIGANCATAGTTSCWQTQYADFTRAIRKPPVYLETPLTPVFNVGVAGDSQYLTVFYPLAMMSPLWDKTSSAIFRTERVHGLLSTAVWINDPSVGVF